MIQVPRRRLLHFRSKNSKRVFWTKRRKHPSQYVTSSPHSTFSSSFAVWLSIYIVCWQHDMWISRNHPYDMFRDHYMILLTFVTFKTQSSFLPLSLFAESFFIAIIVYESERVEEWRKKLLKQHDRNDENLINLTGNDNNHKLVDDPKNERINSDSRKFNYSCTDKAQHCIKNSLNPTVSFLLYLLYE